MLRALLFATALFLPLSSARADTAADQRGNAALQYWQAFAQLPKLSDSAMTKFNEEFATMPLDAKARELAGKADAALKLLRRGAALKNCDWGVSYDQDGIYALLPHLPAARDLASLACLHARLSLQNGHEAEAAEDYAAAMTLARHASLDGSLVGILVGYNIEHRVGESIARSLPKLKADAVKSLQKRLDSLPAFATPAAGLLECEKVTMNWFIRNVNDAKDQESLATFVSSITSNPEAGKKSTLLEDCGGTAAGVVKYAEETGPIYKQVADQLKLPLDQFAKEFDRTTKAHAGNPVFKTFFPAIAKVRLAQARAEVRHALLSAAVAVQAEGRGALKSHADPLAGALFDYVPLAKGFELRSKWTVDDATRTLWKLDERSTRPLVLTVGG